MFSVPESSLVSFVCLFCSLGPSCTWDRGGSVFVWLTPLGPIPRVRLSCRWKIHSFLWLRWTPPPLRWPHFPHYFPIFYRIDGCVFISSFAHFGFNWLFSGFSKWKLRALIWVPALPTEASSAVYLFPWGPLQWLATHFDMLCVHFCLAQILSNCPFDFYVDHYLEQYYLVSEFLGIFQGSFSHRLRTWFHCG